MTDDAISQIAKIIYPELDCESDDVKADIHKLALECFSVVLPTTIEIVSEREALRAENARLRGQLDALTGPRAVVDTFPTYTRIRIYQTQEAADERRKYQ